MTASGMSSYRMRNYLRKVCEDDRFWDVFLSDENRLQKVCEDDRFWKIFCSNAKFFKRLSTEERFWSFLVGQEGFWREAMDKANFDRNFFSKPSILNKAIENRDVLKALPGKPEHLRKIYFDDRCVDEIANDNGISLETGRRRSCYGCDFQRTPGFLIKFLTILEHWTRY